MFNYRWLTFVCFLFHLSLNAQSSKADSLYQLYEQEDSVYLKLSHLLNATRFYYMEGNLEESKRTFTLLVNEAKEYKAPYFELSALNGLAILEASENNEVKQIEIYQEIIQRYNTTQDTLVLSSFKIGNIYHNLYNVYINLGDREKAFESLEKAHDYFSSIDDDYGLSHTYTSYAIFYDDIEEYEKSIHYHKKALESILKSEINNEDPSVTFRFNNLIDTYISYNRLDSALHYVQKFNKLNITPAHFLANIDMLGTKSRVYAKTGDFEKSKFYLNEADKEYKKHEGNLTPSYLFRYLNGRAFVFDEMGQTQKTIAAYNRIVEQFEPQGYNEFVLDAYQSLVHLYDSLGQKELAYDHLVKLQVVEDSLNANEIALKLNNMESKIALVEQEAQNEILVTREQQTRENAAFYKKVSIGAIIIILLIAALSFLLYRTLTRNKKISSKLAHSLGIINEKAAELANTNQQLELFSYSMAHDIQSLQNKILYYAETTYKDLATSSTESRKEAALKTFESAKQLKSFSSNMLLLSNVSHEPQLMKETDIEDVLKEVKANLELYIQENNTNLIYQSMPTLIVYKTRMVQLFQNLIENAIKYAHPDRNTLIEVDYEDQYEYHQFLVKDNGTGIKQEQQQQIFDIFNTGNPTKGSGIGLAVCKQIVEFYSGKISLKQSTSEGSTFEILLPK